MERLAVQGHLLLHPEFEFEHSMGCIISRVKNQMAQLLECSSSVIEGLVLNLV